MCWNVVPTVVEVRWGPVKGSLVTGPPPSESTEADFTVSSC